SVSKLAMSASAIDGEGADGAAGSTDAAGAKKLLFSELLAKKSGVAFGASATSSTWVSGSAATLEVTSSSSASGGKLFPSGLILMSFKLSLLKKRFMKRYSLSPQPGKRVQRCKTRRLPPAKMLA